MRAVRVSAFLVVLSCTPLPSSTPLGGKEWLPPERHADRRPREPSPVVRAEVRSVPEVARPKPSDPKRVIAATAAEPAAPQPAGGTRFQFGPLLNGSVVTLASRLRVNATFTATLQAGTSSHALELDVEERIEVQVLHTDKDGVREVEVRYVSSRNDMRLSGVSTEEKSRTGKRYRVSFRRGVPEVVPASGALLPDEDMQVLFDLATVTGYVPLLRPHLPTNLSAGWNARLDAAQLSAVFGAREGLRFDSASLALRSAERRLPDRAVFDCALSMALERAGLRLEADLRGTCAVRPRDSRPVEVKLSGTLGGGGALPLDGGSSLTGSAELSLEHTYRP